MMDRASKYRARVNVLILATCSGAKLGASSITTRPPGNSTYSVLLGSSGRQSAGVDAARISGMLGCLAASWGGARKASETRIKNLKSRMHQVSHRSETSLAEGKMPRIFICCLVLLAWIGADMQWTCVFAQGYPGGGGGGQIPGGGRGRGPPGGGGPQPGDDISTAPSSEKPDAASRKFFNAGLKSLNK